MHTQGEQQRFSRRHLLGQAAQTAAAASLVPAIQLVDASSISPEAEWDSDLMGVVINARDDHLEVAASKEVPGSSNTIAARPLVGNLRLRPGDRVVVRSSRDGLIAEPLYLSIQGTVEHNDAATVVVGGVVCKLGEAAAVHEHRGAGRPIIRELARAQDLAVGRSVGLLCLQNTQEQSATISTVFI